MNSPNNDSETYRNGDLVKIIKGPHKGHTGRLSTSTIDGYYHIWEEGRIYNPGHSLIYRGLFFRDEFERLS